jgi:hypothetical protein
MASDGVRDQVVLKDVKQWIGTGDPGIVVDHLAGDEAYTGVFEGLFEYGRAGDIRITGEDLRRLASEVFERLRRRPPVWTEASQCPGFIVLWRIVKRRGEAGGYEEWLWSEMTKALPVSLGLANDLREYWAGRYSPLDRDAQKRLWARQQEWAGENLEAPDLCRLLGDAMPNTLAAFVEVSPGAEEWEKAKWVAPLILESLFSCPLVVVPQVVLLIAKTGHRVTDGDDDEGMGRWVPKMQTVFGVERESVNCLFPDPAARRRFLGAMLAANEGEAQWASDVRDAVTQVRTQLAHLLREMDESSRAEERTDKTADPARLDDDSRPEPE